MLETRKLSSGNLMELCIKKGWFTCGTNENYKRILSYADSIWDISTSDIVFFATIIKENSDTEYEIKDICFEISRVCYSNFEGD